MANQIRVIAPYWLGEVGTWVFDDPAVRLTTRPLLSATMPRESGHQAEPEREEQANCLDSGNGPMP
jgi:hypothetical protein